jgi:hypothetical protein
MKKGNVGTLVLVLVVVYALLLSHAAKADELVLTSGNQLMNVTTGVMGVRSGDLTTWTDGTTSTRTGSMELYSDGRTSIRVGDAFEVFQDGSLTMHLGDEQQDESNE